MRLAANKRIQTHTALHGRTDDPRAQSVQPVRPSRCWNVPSQTGIPLLSARRGKLLPIKILRVNLWHPDCFGFFVIEYSAIRSMLRESRANIQLRALLLIGWIAASLAATTPDAVCTLVPGGENCDITSYAVGDVVQVVAGGTSRCMESDAPYSFLYRKGLSNKVVLYFQGGGACWNELSYSQGLCKTSVELSDTDGLLDLDTAINKYANYTFIVPLYCSGDTFLGNSVQPYNDGSGTPVEQRGIINVEAVLNWTVTQQGTGAHLSSTLTELLIGGVSAGAIAAPIWSGRIIDIIPSMAYAVLPDSYILFVPASIEAQLIRGISGNICTSYLVPLDLSASCLAGNLTAVALSKYVMSENRNVAYAYIQAKRDSVQLSYYNAVSASFGMPTIDADTYYNLSKDIINSLNDESNFIIFMIDSDSHGYTYNSLYFSAGSAGDTSGGLQAWVEELPLELCSSIQSACSGEDCNLVVVSKVLNGPCTDYPTGSPTAQPSDCPARMFEGFAAEAYLNCTANVTSVELSSGSQPGYFVLSESRAFPIVLASETAVVAAGGVMQGACGQGAGRVVGFSHSSFIGKAAVDGTANGVSTLLLNIVKWVGQSVTPLLALQSGVSSFEDFAEAKLQPSDYATISDSAILSGGLASYDVLFAQADHYASEDLVNALRNFLLGGGGIIFSGTPW